jgi:hypothetical protein
MRAYPPFLGYLESDTVRLLEDGKVAYIPAEPMTGGASTFLLVLAYLSSCVDPRRINWAGTALSAFYAAIRKALVVVIVLRAIGMLVGLVLAGWWVFG